MLIFLGKLELRGRIGADMRTHYVEQTPHFGVPEARDLDHLDHLDQRPDRARNIISLRKSNIDPGDPGDPSCFQTP